MLFLKVGRKLVQVDLENIRYIQSSNIYCLVYLKNGERLICTSTLQALEEKLKLFRFIRIHRCYIVNVSEISVIDKSSMSIYLNELPDPLPISRRYKPFIAKLEHAV